MFVVGLLFLLDCVCVKQFNKALQGWVLCVLFIVLEITAQIQIDELEVRIFNFDPVT
jgi:hypothetical protein